MRRLIPFVLFACSVAMPALAGDNSVASVAVRAHFANRTALTVSSHVLQFDVPQQGESTTTTVDFSAAARTAAGEEIVLTVEALRGIDGPGGAADVETGVSYEGEGAGTLSGTMNPAAPSVVARWHGSGIHDGHLTFTLHTSAAGHYAVPVRFVISTP
ncbi:MAG TPA: hypothetical protein VFX12_03370 [Vicinamibacterales bacterium]|nr:hypothetical protein [Vicinamibacterales bacterium]